MQRQYKVCAAFDTETCNFGQGPTSRAYVVCYQVNDLRKISLKKYAPGKTDDFKIYRYQSEMIAYIKDLIEWGRAQGKIPIIAAYNLMFDLKSLIFDLRQEYEMEVNAQSSTSVYTLDLLGEDDKTVLRFWDTFYLDMRGLVAMGEVAGLPKALGDWDYSLIRTPETELTDQEVFYATRDVQVIPAYLKYLLDANAWLSPDMLGNRVLTKTSLVRQMAVNEFKSLAIPNARQKGLTVQSAFIQLCKTELARTFDEYALQKACFRGGLTFTSAKYASTVVENVCSMDTVSMHHTFIACMQPIQFERASAETLQKICENVCKLTRKQILTDYQRPFDAAFHACVRFEGLRLKRGSCFEDWGIATLARGKLGLKLETALGYQNNDAAREQEESNRRGGWRDRIGGACEVAFGKVYAAQTAEIFLNEIELWNMSRVYEWDSMQALFGQATFKFVRAPDYVTLQSNMLYKMKDALKQILKRYRQGEPFAGEVSELLPDALRAEIKAGRAERSFLESYYGSTVKGMFNGIYGTQAQDVYKPKYQVLNDGDLEVNHDEVTTEDNFSEHQPKTPKVLYPYGMRIVGRSRMHLVLAMELLADEFGGRVRVTGGDTDSIKASCDSDITDEMLLNALKPLHDAADKNINHCYKRIRKNFPDLASDMANVGHFEVEAAGPTTRYLYHIELWNKARISIDAAYQSHVTCAGLSRPSGAYNMEDYINDQVDERGPREVLRDCIGYNTYVDHSLSFSMERTSPKNGARFVGAVRDYRGHVAHIDAPEVFAIYDTGRFLGELTKAANVENISYLKRHYGREVDSGFKDVGK